MNLKEKTKKIKKKKTSNQLNQLVKLTIQVMKLGYIIKIN
jgi:hypothetical protein